MTERSRDQELLSGIPEGLDSIGGLANPGFAFTPEEPKVVPSRYSSIESQLIKDLKDEAFPPFSAL